MVIQEGRFLKDLLVLLYCWSVLPPCMSVHHTWAEPWRSEEGVGYPGQELQMVLEHHLGAGN